MTEIKFVDWRNRQEKNLEPPILEHIERFQVLPQADLHENISPVWETYPTVFTEITPVVSNNYTSWANCPSVNRTYLEEDDNYESAIAEAYGTLSPTLRMKLHNQGTHNGKWEEKRVLHKMDNWYRCDTIASRLELTNLQKARVQVLLSQLNLQKEGRSIEQVVFALSALVCREDGRRTRPSKKSDQVFREFATRQGWNDRKVRSLIGRCQSDWQDRLPLKAEKRTPPEEPRKKKKDGKEKKYWTVYTIELTDKREASKRSI